jgi:phosphoribosylanthranilate isomerase
MTEIKICGITRLEDALYAAACGADAVGFIFHEARPRYISPRQAKEIIAQLSAEITKVGVFVNREPDEVKRTVEACGLDLIQLHGDESPVYCRRFSPERVIKAVSLRTAEELLSLADYEGRTCLVSARDTDRYG